MGTIVSGLVAVGGLVKAYQDGGGGWTGITNIPSQLWNGGLTDSGKMVAIGTGGYVALKSTRRSLEPSPMARAGRLSVYLL